MQKATKLTDRRRRSMKAGGVASQLPVGMSQSRTTPKPKNFSGAYRYTRKA